MVRNVFELRALAWGKGWRWQGCGTNAKILFLVRIYRYPFLTLKKLQEQYPFENQIPHNCDLHVFFYDGY